MTEVAAVDVGGTHVRFAVAEVEAGRVTRLGPESVMKTAEHASLQAAWKAFASSVGRSMPRYAAIAVACPVQGDVLQLTNNPWVIRPGELPEALGLDRLTLVNDFAAVAHAVAQVPAADLRHLCGPDMPLPRTGVISVVGPGTGLGVAALLRNPSGNAVISTEGGHLDFAPLDRTEDAILCFLRARYGRVSAERIVSGPGLGEIYGALAAIEGSEIEVPEVRSLWAAAITGRDQRAVAALNRFCLSLGSVSGDIALVQGATGVVIAGGVGLRLADYLPSSGFAQRFAAKGRFAPVMSRIPVKVITHPQPGLYGAAVAMAEEHCL